MKGGFLAYFSDLVAGTLSESLATTGQNNLTGKINLERPASRQHGDLATNIALIAAGPAGVPPRQLAVKLLEKLTASPELHELCSSIKLAGPGFINFTLAPDALIEAARQALAQGPDFGSGTIRQPQKMLIEFVSANPTGPLHAGHARYAAYGDSLKRLLEFTGNEVTAEFYINDYGSQMDLFACSLAACYAGLLGQKVPFPEDGYQGEYVKGMAERIKGEIGEKYAGTVSPEPDEETLEYFKKRGCELMLEEIKEELGRFRVHFDSWYSEAGLYSSGAAQEAVEELKKAGEAVENEGALWLQTSRYGDDKDRVLIRSSGEPTYFASDIAYHRDKLSRGFDRLIDIWGADHHGYVARMKAAFAALSHDQEQLEIIIGQLVNVVEMGERKQMSKRAGQMVSLKELLDSIGVDAARFYLVDRSHDSTLDLDLKKATLQSEENPVYYVQYAHARICSILKKAEAEGAGTEPGNSYNRVEDEERELILKLLEFPQITLAAADSRSPQRITAYSRELAAIFHVFYHNCPVIKAEAAASAFRLDLCRLTRNVISRSLGLVGVSAPESM